MDGEQCLERSIRSYGSGEIVDHWISGGQIQWSSGGRYAWEIMSGDGGLAVSGIDRTTIGGKAVKVQEIGRAHV